MGDVDEAELAAAIALSNGGVDAAPQRPPEVEAAIKNLQSNPSTTLEANDTIKILRTLLGNVLQDPGNPKFRKVKTSNAKIRKAVIETPGAEALLLAAGFSRTADGDALELVSGTDVSGVQVAEQALSTEFAAVVPFALGRVLSGHEGGCRCCCALPDGGVGTGAMDNMVRVFSPNTGEPLVLVGHERKSGVDGVLGVIAVCDGKLASAGRDGRIILWEKDSAAVFQRIATWDGHGDQHGVQGTNSQVVSALAVSSEGALLSGGWDKTARVWADGHNQVLSGHELAVNSVIGLEDGRIASGSGDGSIRIWQGSKCVATLQLPKPVPVRAICSAGSGIASVGNDGFVRLWSLSGSELKNARAANDYLFAISFCSSTKEIATGGNDGVVKIWSMDLELRQSLAHAGEVYGLCFFTVGDLAVACGDGSCVLWTRDAAKKAPKAVADEFAMKVNIVQAANAPAPSAPTSISGTQQSGQWDFSYPVSLGQGGREMTISWNRGEDATAVASRFLQQNGMPDNETHRADIIAFMGQAQQRGGGGYGGGAGGGGGGGGSFDFSYPVEVADGRKLNIQWNRGDDPQAVAMTFAMQNGIGPHELQDIIGFIQQVSGMPPTPAMSVAQSNPQVSEAQKTALLAQVMEMGFDEPRARQALEATGWMSAEAAVMKLLG